jgi:hypothetical protein
MQYRPRVFCLPLAGALALAILAIVACPSAMATQSELAAEDACAEVRLGITQLAKAERAQADALQLARNGGDFAPVASQLHQVLERSADLRITLRNFGQGKLAHDAAVANCLKLGNQILREAEKLTTEVEQILLDMGGVGAGRDAAR